MTTSETCRICGVRRKHVRVHERQQHGIYERGPKAASSQRILAAARARQGKAGKRAAAVTRTEVVHVPVPLHQEPSSNGSQSLQTFTQMPFVVLEGSDGGIWLAERIK
jgi:hypothetical protein